MEIITLQERAYSPNIDCSAVLFVRLEKQVTTLHLSACVLFYSWVVRRKLTRALQSDSTMCANEQLMGMLHDIILIM